MIHTQCSSFHAVASEGALTAAVRTINIGQPTITSQMKNKVTKGPFGFLTRTCQHLSSFPVRFRIVAIILPIWGMCGLQFGLQSLWST